MPVMPSVTVSVGGTAYPTGITGILAYTSQTSGTGPWNFVREYPNGTDAFILSDLLAEETYYARLIYRNAFGVIDPASALILGPYTTGSLISTDTANVGSRTAAQINADLDAAATDLTAAVAQARREAAGIAQRADARIARALAQAQTESLRALNENTRIEQLIIGVSATLEGDYLTTADAATTYLASANLESAVASIDLSLNAAFEAVQDDLNAAEGGSLANVVAAIDASYVVQSDIDDSIALFNLDVGAAYDLPATVTAAQADATASLAAIASANRATARAQQSLSARFASALAAQSSEVLASASATQSVVQKIDTLTATVAGNRAEVIADYLASANLDSALISANFTGNTTFQGALDDIDAIELDLDPNEAGSIAETVATIQAAYMAYSDIESAFTEFSLTLGAGYDLPQTVTDAQADATQALTAIATANRATARATQSLMARIASSLASASSEVLASASATQAAVRSIDTLSASVDGIDAITSILQEAFVDTSDPANPVAIARIVLEAAAGGGDPAYISLTDGLGSPSAAVIAADQVVLANMGAGSNEIQKVLEAVGGYAFFARPVSIDDDPTPTIRTIFGPTGDTIIWAGDPTKTPATATAANSDFAIGVDGLVYLGGALIGGLAELDDISPDEVATGYSLVRSGTGAPTPGVDNGLYTATGPSPNVAWVVDGTDAIRISREQQTNIMASNSTITASGSNGRCVCKVLFESASEVNRLLLTAAAVDYQTNGASADTVTGQWFVYISDTDYAVNDVVGSARALWTGGPSGLTFVDSAGNNEPLTDDYTNAIIGSGADDVDDLVGDEGGADIYVYLALKVTGGSVYLAYPGTTATFVLE